MKVCVCVCGLMVGGHMSVWLEQGSKGTRDGGEAGRQAAAPPANAAPAARPVAAGLLSPPALPPACCVPPRPAPPGRQRPRLSRAAAAGLSLAHTEGPTCRIIPPADLSAACSSTGPRLTLTTASIRWSPVRRLVGAASWLLGPLSGDMRSSGGPVASAAPAAADVVPPSPGIPRSLRRFLPGCSPPPDSGSAAACGLGPTGSAPARRRPLCRVEPGGAAAAVVGEACAAHCRDPFGDLLLWRGQNAWQQTGLHTSP